jgi:Fe-S-cluster-containing dehydrogenase component
VERMDQGLKPSCVHHCPTNALYLRDYHEFPPKAPG